MEGEMVVIESGLGHASAGHRAGTDRHGVRLRLGLDATNIRLDNYRDCSRSPPQLHSEGSFCFPCLHSPDLGKAYQLPFIRFFALRTVPLRTMSLRTSLRVPLRAYRGVHRPNTLGLFSRAGYATTSQTQTNNDKPLPDIETFDKTSRPGLYYARPSPRDLPPLKVSIRPAHPLHTI